MYLLPSLSCVCRSCEYDINIIEMTFKCYCMQMQINYELQYFF